jgi:hypothetical protein
LDDPPPEPPGIPFVTWPYYLYHEKQIATNTQKLADLDKAITELQTTAKDTNEKVTQHIADEDKVWMKMEKKQDDAYTQFNQKLDALSTAGGTIKKSTVERWFWKTFGILVSVPFALYYLILLWSLAK